MIVYKFIIDIKLIKLIQLKFILTLFNESYTPKLITIMNSYIIYQK